MNRSAISPVLTLVLASCVGETPPVSPPDDAARGVSAEPAAPAAPAAREAPAWLDEAVEAALEWEIMPGTTGEPTPERAEELRAFFASHPEYEDPQRRALLADPACGLASTEAAHELLQAPAETEPLVVEVSGEGWAVVVAHVDVLCTSDDWTTYSHDALQAGADAGATTAYASADNPVVLVRAGEQELARVALEGQGFLVVRAGQEPAEIGYDPSAPEQVRVTLGGAP